MAGLPFTTPFKDLRIRGEVFFFGPTSVTSDLPPLRSLGPCISGLPMMCGDLREDGHCAMLKAESSLAFVGSDGLQDTTPRESRNISEC